MPTNSRKARDANQSFPLAQQQQQQRAKTDAERRAAREEYHALEALKPKTYTYEQALCLKVAQEEEYAVRDVQLKRTFNGVRGDMQQAVLLTNELRARRGWTRGSYELLTGRTIHYVAANGDLPDKLASFDYFSTFADHRSEQQRSLPFEDMKEDELWLYFDPTREDRLLLALASDRDTVGRYFQALSEYQSL